VTSSPRTTQFQYFLSFAVLGAIVPFVSVLLAERGLSKAEIGNVWAVSALGVILTPILVTLLADTAIQPRFLMAALYALTATFLALLWPAKSYVPILALYALHTFCLQPVFPLQDGIHFAAQAARRAIGMPEIPYTAVRIWGTAGYFVPSVALYFVLKEGGSTGAVLVCGLSFAAIGAVNALFLPHPPAVADERIATAAHSRLPTAAAARAILEPHVLIFCIAMFLIHLASQVYYQFYPIHLTDRSGLDKRWVGLIANVGVLAEIPFMLGFAWLVRKMTLRRLMYWGAIVVGARLFLLALFPGPVVGIGVQLLHGPTVLVIHVAPPIFLNARADDRYRNSIQGLYTRAFAGAGKVIGSWASGITAEWSLPWTFAGCGFACLVATALFYFAFHDGRAEPEAA
jgi:PPP family 3-phenylpropionic acid transporter